MFDKDADEDRWISILWDEKTKTILYDPAEIFDTNFEITTNMIINDCSSCVYVQKDNIEGFFGISNDYIETIVKNDIADSIRERKFANDSYIWVNEVINYDGGEDYAIRRVHPNLKETEGTYLSTSMQDIKGNFPYLVELEGIKADGELFFTYYFKKLDSNDVSEKITYAKLYKDYDWIIAMGVHLDDINAYTEQVNIETDALVTENMIRAISYILAVMLLGFVVLFVLERKQMTVSTGFLENEVNRDLLTKASSRRFGEKFLMERNKQWMIDKDSPAIMMLDIDDFRMINNKYGHDIGDVVLIEMTKAIKQVIRASDCLIRWGGDEFVGIFPGLKEEQLVEFGKKLTNSVNSLSIDFNNEVIKITVSIGFSYFDENDTDYKAVLKRADEALYKSKSEGKNRVNVIV